MNNIIKIPNKFERFADFNDKSFSLFKSNLDVHYWDILTISYDKIVDINIHKLLLKLKLPTNYNASGLAIDNKNKLVYVKLENNFNIKYIYSNLNSNCTKYYNWKVLSKEMEDNMDKEALNSGSNETDKEKHILTNIEEQEEDNLENHMLNAIDHETIKSTMEENLNCYEEREMIMSKLDEYIESGIYLENEVPTAKQFMSRKTFDNVYYDDFNNACSAIFSKKVNEIRDPMFRDYVASDLGNKAFESFKNMLYIAEMFTKNNPFRYFSNEKSFEIKGFSTYDAFYDENNRSRISFEILLDPLTDRNDNPGLRICLTVFVEFSYMTEKKEIKKRMIPMGTVISNIRPIDVQDKYMITVSEDNNNLFDYAKTITYIYQSAEFRCTECSNIGKDCCLRVGGQLKNSDVNITIKNGCIPITENIIDFLKSSKKLTNDIFAMCTILSERD